jgi:hypothetical protein
MRPVCGEFTAGAHAYPQHQPWPRFELGTDGRGGATYTRVLPTVCAAAALPRWRCRFPASRTGRKSAQSLATSTRPRPASWPAAAFVSTGGQDDLS